MDDPKNQIAERLQQATNILVTVSKNPSVDQLSAAIGITLLLNKLDKHAIAVFSGQVPSTIEFLQPEQTFEKTTDSLRDFIIALDKSKADKLRYKVEDQMVKIFITPYRTSLSEQDLEFSQGDFNVEVVLAIGVNDPTDLDQAIISHGRILHDATVISANIGGNSTLGSINWIESSASSLSEMMVELGQLVKADALDAQMATAFLTGIVAETERFSNEKTSPETMQISSRLMAAGANQQLVATQLQSPGSPMPIAPADKPAAKTKDGSLAIDHDAIDVAPDEEFKKAADQQIHIDEEGTIKPPGVEEALPPSQSSTRGMALEPPKLGGKLTANVDPESTGQSIDMMIGGDDRDQPLLRRDNSPGNLPLADTEADKIPLPEPPVPEPPQALPEPEPPVPPEPPVEQPIPEPPQTPLTLPDFHLGPPRVTLPPPPIMPLPPPPEPPLTSPEPPPPDRPLPPSPTESALDASATAVAPPLSQILPSSADEPPPSPVVPLSPPLEPPPQEPLPPPVNFNEPGPTLTDLEKKVDSDHLKQVEEPPVAPPPPPIPTLEPPPPDDSDLGAARDAVMQAMETSESPAVPPPSSGVDPGDLDLSQLTVPGASSAAESADEPVAHISALENTSSDPGLPPGLIPTTPLTDNTATSASEPSPPPVPPPLFGDEDPFNNAPPAPGSQNPNNGSTGDDKPLAPPVL